MNATAVYGGVAAFEGQLNQALLSGKAMEAFESFYDDNVVMQENLDEPTSGKAANCEREIAFFSSVAEVHGMKLYSSAVSGDRSFSEWEYDVTFKGGVRARWAQVAVRVWKNGKVIHERFYYNKG